MRTVLIVQNKDDGPCIFIAVMGLVADKVQMANNRSQERRSGSGNRPLPSGLGAEASYPTSCSSDKVLIHRLSYIQIDPYLPGANFPAWHPSSQASI